jgi:hypothetical protein
MELQYPAGNNRQIYLYDRYHFRARDDVVWHCYRDANVCWQAEHLQHVLPRVHAEELHEQETGNMLLLALISQTALSSGCKVKNKDWNYIDFAKGKRI